MRRTPKPRHEDLMRLIAARRKAEALAPLVARQEELAKTLDALNAYDALDVLRRKKFAFNTCFGPKPYYGGKPGAWVGVLIWKRAPGYYGYKTLTLYGAWARDLTGSPESTEGGIEIAVGSKVIPYTSEFYVAEAYFKLIRDGFEDYYSDDGRPPLTLCATFTYDRANRLEQRQTLAAALAQCVGG